MIPYLNILDNCCECDNCIAICPENAIEKKESQYIVDQWSCSLCSICIEVCPDEAIKIKESEETL